MKLEREEVHGIFGVLVHTMDLDHERSQDERHFLLKFLRALGPDDAELEAVLTAVYEHPEVEWHVDKIKSRQGRVYALQQALLLALADGEYRVVEEEGLRTLADNLGIDDVLFDEIEAWAAQGAAWQIKGAALLAR